MFENEYDPVMDQISDLIDATLNVVDKMRDALDPMGSKGSKITGREKIAIAGTLLFGTIANLNNDWLAIRDRLINPNPGDDTIIINKVLERFEGNNASAIASEVMAILLFNADHVDNLIRSIKDQ